MATMRIRNIDDELSKRLWLRAARHGRSVEEDAFDIVRVALNAELLSDNPPVQEIRARVEPVGGVELVLPSRETNSESLADSR